MKLENLKLNLETELVLNVGDPIGKTNAPRCYNKLFERLDMNAIMLPCEIKKGQLPQFMDACRLMGIHYLCPTMPHKGDIIPLLDDVDELSRVFHSVNAVKIDPDGTSHGVGMDGRGTVNALLAAGVKLDGARVMLVGAGAICGVIGVELSRQGVKALEILNRTRDKAQAIAEKLNAHTSMKAAADTMDAASLARGAERADILIQATPLGMKGYGADYQDLSFIDRLPGHATVMDVVLNPSVTAIRRKAMERGLATVPGMEMLLGQMDAIFGYLWDVKLTREDKEACADALCAHLGVER